MIDLAKETIVPLSVAGKKELGRPHISTLHRWSHGLSDGRRLETVKIGGKVFTSIEACRRFIASGSRPDVNVVDSSTNDKIERQLDEEGL